MFMSKPLDLSGRRVFITGASAGLGQALAYRAAQEHRADIVAVARRRERLDALKHDIESRYNVKVTPIVTDLTQVEAAQRAFDIAVADGPIHAAILNAGVTAYGRVLEHSKPSIDSILQTNVSTLVLLAQAFGKHMVANGDGGLMLVSSVAGFAPMPYQAVYGASKAFVTSYGLALRHELRGSGISVTVFAPGGMATEMLELSGLSRKFKADDVGIMSADQCARIALQALIKRKGLSVPGPGNKLASLGMRLGPQPLVMHLIDRIYRGGLNPSA